jgi:hypothetical protein
MDPKLRSAEPTADTPDKIESQSSHHSSRDISSPPLDALALVMEEMALINSRMDAHAAHGIA